MEHNSIVSESEVSFSVDTAGFKDDLLSFGSRGNMPSIEVSPQPDATIGQPLDKRCYTVEDLQIMLSCGRETVYSLLAMHEFKWFRLGGRRGPYRISKKSFDEWLEQLL